MYVKQFSLGNDIFLAIEQTWIIQILFNLERRRYQDLKAFWKTLCHSLTASNFFRHFRVSPEFFYLIMNSIVPSLSDDNAWPRCGGPILPKKKKLSSVFLWCMANQETIREVSNTSAIDTTTVHKIVVAMSLKQLTKIYNYLTLNKNFYK